MIQSKINTDSPDFRANSEHMESLVGDLREKVAKIAGNAFSRTLPNGCL